MKYAVMVIPISPRPWTESVEDSMKDAVELKRKIESLKLRNIEVHITPLEETV